MVSMLQCVLTTTECILLLKIGMLEALETRVGWDLALVVMEDTEEVQELVPVVKNLEAKMKALKVVLNQLPVVEARDLAPVVEMNPLEVTVDQSQEVVAQEQALKVDLMDLMALMALMDLMVLMVLMVLMDLMDLMDLLALCAVALDLDLLAL